MQARGCIFETVRHIDHDGTEGAQHVESEPDGLQPGVVAGGTQHGEQGAYLSEEALG